MELLEGCDHQSGVHCGAAALRNVTAYYPMKRVPGRQPLCAWRDLDGVAVVAVPTADGP